jgi:hypothetical protein
MYYRHNIIKLALAMLSLLICSQQINAQSMCRASRSARNIPRFA